MKGYALYGTYPTPVPRLDTAGCRKWYTAGICYSHCVTDGLITLTSLERITGTSWCSYLLPKTLPLLILAFENVYTPPALFS